LEGNIEFIFEASSSMELGLDPNAWPSQHTSRSRFRRDGYKDACPKTPKQSVLGLFSDLHQSREVNDSGGVGVAKLNPPLEMECVLHRRLFAYKGH